MLTIVYSAPAGRAKFGSVKLRLGGLVTWQSAYDAGRRGYLARALLLTKLCSSNTSSSGRMPVKSIRQICQNIAKYPSKFPKCQSKLSTDTARGGLCVDRWVPIRALAEGWCSAARTECVLLVECVTIKAAELSRNGGRDDRRRCGCCVRGDNINSVCHLATEDGCSGPSHWSQANLSTSQMPQVLCSRNFLYTSLPADSEPASSCG